ncbi:protein TolB [Campylobacterota bacterium]|nr:protein TolB [Campylobacterota bacterium]
MKKTILFLLSALYLFAADATLEVIKEVGSALNVIVEPKNRYQSDLDKRIGRAIEADLKVAGFYNVLPVPANAAPTLEIDNPVYRNLNHLVRYEFFRENGKIGIRTEAFDIRTKRTILAQSYTVTREDRFVFLAHNFVKDLADKLGTANLEWMGRYVLLSRHLGAKETEILIADYSLTFQQTIVKGGFNVFPKWADNSQTAYYFTKYLDKPTLFKVDLYSGERTKIIESEGMLVCSDVSADGKKLLLTMAPDDQPDIYEYDTTSKKLRRLTTFNGIDVSGHYLEDDSAFVFVSDRLGYPEIFYSQLSDPNNAIQFVFKGRNNNYIDTFGNYAVFVSRETDSEFADNTFNLYLISTKSDYIRQLTTTYKNNFPRFSSSGDTIMYTKEMRRESALGIIRLPYQKSFLFPLESGWIQAIDW